MVSGFRKSLALAPLSLLAWSASPSRAAYLDGQPKYIHIPPHFSWHLSTEIMGGLQAMGYTAIEALPVHPPAGNNFGGDQYNGMPVDDQLNPIGWLAPGSVERQALGATHDRPTIFFGDCHDHPIRGAQDTATINLEVRKLDKLAGVLKGELGFSDVFFYASHCGRARAADTNTAPAGTDTLVIAAYNRLHPNHGVNVFTPAQTDFPYSTKSDFEHPSGPTGAFYAKGLAKAILMSEGAAEGAPEVAAAMAKGDQALAKANQNQHNNSLHWLGPQIDAHVNLGAEQRIGASIQVPLHLASGNTYCVLLTCYQGGRIMEYELETDYKSAGDSVVKAYTIPTQANVHMYSPVSGMPLPVKGDSARIEVIAGDHSVDVTDAYWLSDPFKLLNADGSPSWKGPTVGLRPVARGVFGGQPPERNRRFDAAGRHLPGTSARTSGQARVLFAP